MVSPTQEQNLLFQQWPSHDMGEPSEGASIGRPSIGSTTGRPSIGSTTEAEDMKTPRAIGPRVASEEELPDEVDAADVDEIVVKEQTGPSPHPSDSSFFSCRDQNASAVESPAKVARDENHADEAGSSARAKLINVGAISAKRISVPESMKVKFDDVLAVTAQLQARLSAIVHDPTFKVVSISGGGSAAALAAAGGSCGLVMGSATGLAVGLVPSLLTFGISIPVCATVGGVVGTGSGALAGGCTGLVGGGVVGGVAYAYRLEIKDRAVCVHAQVIDIASYVAESLRGASLDTRTKVIHGTHAAQAAVRSCIRRICQQTSDFSTCSCRVVKDPQFQVSAASAAAGAAVLGAGGGAAGLTAGTLVGATVGLVPALFTFGLSIPVGAAVGGGAGLCLGVASGASAGAVGGGAAGYGAYSKREEIRGAMVNMKAQALGSASYVQLKARDSASFVRTKIMGGSTGGTE